MKTQNKAYKKKGNSIFLILAGVMLIFSFSCKKYLDVKQTSGTSLITTASDCQLLLDRYEQMNIGYPSDGEASTDNYYLKDADYNALSSEDRAIYSWASNTARSTANPQWLNAYTVVNYANTVLEALNRINADAATLNTLKGSALFYRTYAFHQIAMLYCKPYIAASAAQDPGIPLRLSSDVNVKSVRGTVQQTYNQMIQDLQNCVNLLPSASTVSSRPNKAAAYALLARIYLSMADYTNAKNAANSCLQINNNLIDYNTLSLTSSQPFTRFNREVIFQSVMAGTIYTEIGGTYFPVGATLNPSIAWVDSVLCTSYQDNDLRKQIFLKQGDGPLTGYKFSGSYEPTSDNTLFSGLATDEIYLIRAECYARTGDKDNALKDLNALLLKRWATDTFVPFTAVDADDALKKILAERRKELIFRGLRWSDLRRLNMENSFTITLSRQIGGQTYNLPPNDSRYVLLIPQDVISNSEMSQNLR